MAENLKCSICNKDATVHLTQIVNNKIHKVDLCETCAQNKGITNTDGFSLADMLANAPLHPVESDDKRVCSVCGFQTADFRQTGRLGCAHCYSIFGDLLRPVLQDMHAGTKHLGKVPTFALVRQSNANRIHDLRRSLARAIAEEAYEQAAKFRDEIQALEVEEAGTASKT
ncbi:MAG: UvrB/UvrC motif-containing protein [Verrucomicrobiota bacterium]